MIAEILILLLAIPIGYLIAWLTKDELLLGKKWFKVLIVFSIIAGIIFYFYKKADMSLTAIFVLIISVISLIKSYDKKWTKKV